MKTPPLRKLRRSDFPVGKKWLGQCIEILMGYIRSNEGREIFKFSGRAVEVPKCPYLS